MAMDDDMQTFARKVRTNGDKIRAMTDEELATFLNEITTACHARGAETDDAERELICKDCPIGDYTGCCEHSILFYLNKKAL